ncbi:MAG: hypothetical protein IJC76_08645 [Lachnospiraceae bacterium]|nr:hypothetical protein [Lachnospiraceae bacterium]
MDDIILNNKMLSEKLDNIGNIKKAVVILQIINTAYVNPIENSEEFIVINKSTLYIYLKIATILAIKIGTCK